MIQQKIVNFLLEANLTISTCESMTGGLLASQIVAIENASKVFLGGFVSYSKQSKKNIVGIPKKIIDQYGTISQECALSMAINTQKKFKSDISISITGNASLNNPDENKQSGIAYITICYLKNRYNFFYQKHLAKTREEIQLECTKFVFHQLFHLIQKKKN